MSDGERTVGHQREFNGITATEEDLSRFWGRVALPNERGCLRWLGPLNDSGYGTIWIGNKKLRAHRVSYTVNVSPIPLGLQLDHLCRVRECVAPDHLEPVAHRVNILRGETVTARNAAATRCPKGHQYDAANTYHNPSGSRTCRACHRDWARAYRAALKAGDAK